MANKRDDTLTLAVKVGAVVLIAQMVFLMLVVGVPLEMSLIVSGAIAVSAVVTIFITGGIKKKGK